MAPLNKESSRQQTQKMPRNQVSMRVDRSYDNINRSMIVGGSQGAANDQNTRRSNNVNSSFRAGRNSNSTIRPPLPFKKNTLLDPYSGANYQSEDQKPTLGLSLKLEIAKKPMNERAHYQETAFVLEEILQAAAKGQTQLPLRQKRQFENRAILLKREKQEKEAEEERKRREKYERRRRELDHVIHRQAEEAKKKRDVEEKEKQEKQEKEQRENEKKKREVQQFYSKMRQRAQEEKMKRDRLAEEELERKKQEEQQKKQKQRQLTQVMKQKQEDLKQSYQQQKQQKKQLEEEEKAQELRQKEKEQKKKEKMKQVYNQNKEQLKELKQREKEELLEFATSDAFQNLLQTYQTSLQSTFSKNCKAEGNLVDKMNQKAFTKLCNSSSIVPQLITAQEAILIFKTVQAEKQVGKEQESTLLVYHEFIEALVKVGAKAKGKLGVETDQTGPPKKQLTNIASQSQIMQKDFDVEGMQPETMENLFKQMGLVAKKKGK